MQPYSYMFPNNSKGLFDSDLVTENKLSTFTAFCPKKFLFQKYESSQEGVPPLSTCTNKGGRGSKRGQFYVNVIIELPFPIPT